MTTDGKTRPTSSIAGLIGRERASGRVVTRVGPDSELRETVEPLQGVEVWLRAATRKDPPRRTWSDGDGRFTFRDVPSGDYRVVWWVEEQGIMGPVVTVAADG